MRRTAQSRETLIALRATHAAHRIATAVQLSRITDLERTTCHLCGHPFVPPPDAEGLSAVVCPTCWKTPERLYDTGPRPESVRPPPRKWHQTRWAVLRRWILDLQGHRRGES